MGDFLFKTVFILLILLGAVSFTLFIRPILISAKAKTSASNELNNKLDKIIELLEKQDKQIYVIFLSMGIPQNFYEYRKQNKIVGII
ncbi:DUF4083 domain-containing protein [Bacillus sp. IITD106]|nr:DUF4083 domain-containing protein [Bacillus sp. IITD106]